jgi:transketolase
LDNLCLFIDKNSVQASGTTEEIFAIHNISGKFAAFGWNVIDIDGHNIKEIQDAIAKADATKGVPTVIVAKTIKGKGFPFAEGKCQFHNASLTEEQYQECLDCIEKMKEEL